MRFILILRTFLILSFIIRTLFLISFIIWILRIFTFMSILMIWIFRLLCPLIRSAISLIGLIIWLRLLIVSNIDGVISRNESVFYIKPLHQNFGKVYLTLNVIIAVCLWSLLNQRASLIAEEVIQINEENMLFFLRALNQSYLQLIFLYFSLYILVAL